MSTILDLGLAEKTIALLVALFALLLLQAQRRGLSCLDLITDKGNNKMSLTKTLNLLGGVIGAWAVTKMALNKNLTWDILAVYLAYCGSTHGFSTWLSAKFRPGEEPKL